ncbi:hypothetical protein ELQ57_19440 [Salmonella enterica subsp. enterica serovar Teko]|nr:hypothetical protein [Salmonella enterica]EAA7937537.1 hypothetical protein [Salmonella enterica subsp. enterica serovar Teko]EDV9143210.1 hypothetical protein [Salmonella enterica subsp. enterica serovar Gombe]EDV9732147.1 hypothetical protein [Salmonella enterica subsp. enterica]EAQ2080587.1 hypothetical protein [Salmonella enterica]
MSSNLLMESFDELYVLLYSESQKCFRIDSVSHVIDKNIRMYLGEKNNDYVSFAFAATVEELCETRDHLIEKRGDIAVPWFLVQQEE